MKRFLILFSALVLAGCEQPGVATNITNNPNFHVTELFQHDGCKVYRFSDGGNYRYFVNCGTHASTSSRYSCGKSCSRVEDIHTENTNDKR